MSAIVITYDPPAYAHVFEEWDGPVGQHLVRICRTIEVRAMATVGFDTGRLLASIDTAFDPGLVAHVGANPRGMTVGYGLYHHTGTRPHKIAARNSPYLRFPDRKRGGFIYAKSVNHPGTKANPYLTEPLREAITR